MRGQVFCGCRTGGAEVQAVGDEAAGALVFEAALDDGMAGGEEFEGAGVVDLRAHPAAKGGDMGEVGEKVDFGDVARGLADARGVGEDVAAELGEDAALDVGGALLSGQNLSLEIFELGGGEAFGVDEGLLALVVGRDGFGVGFGDFEVVAEDGIEADFERGDAGAFALAGLDVGDELAAVGGEGAEVVEFGVEAGADDVAVGEVDGRFVGEGAGDAFVEIGEGVEGGGEMVPATGGMACGEVGGGGAKAWEARECGAEGDELAGTGGLHGDAAEEALEVEDAVHGAAKGFAAADVGGGDGYGVEARVDGCEGLHGAKQLRAEEALAHGGAAGVEGPEEGGLGAFGGEERVDEFEVADADGVEFEAVAAFVEAEGVEVVEGTLLGGAEVVDDGSGGGGGGVVAGETEAVEGVEAELLAEQGKGVVFGEGPVFDLGAGGSEVEGGGVFGVGVWVGFRWGGFAENALAEVLGCRAEVGSAVAGVDEFGGAHACELVEGEGPGGWAGELGGAEVAGGEIDGGYADGGGCGGADGGDAGEPLAFAGVECGVDGGAGGEDAGDFAADDGFGGPGIFHLLAEGNAVAFAEETLEVAAGGVIGDAAHGYGAGFVAGCEGELEFARGDDGVFVEELVEVAEAEEDEGVGVGVFGGAMLPHDGGEDVVGGLCGGVNGHCLRLAFDSSEYRRLGEFAGLALHWQGDRDSDVRDAVCGGHPAAEDQWYRAGGKVWNADQRRRNGEVRVRDGEAGGGDCGPAGAASVVVD